MMEWHYTSTSRSEMTLPGIPGMIEVEISNTVYPFFFVVTFSWFSRLAFRENNMTTKFTNWSKLRKARLTTEAYKARDLSLCNMHKFSLCM